MIIQYQNVYRKLELDNRGYLLDLYSMKIISYYPVIKTYNPFTPSKSIVELIKKNLCTNFIFTQSKVIIIKIINLKDSSRFF